MLLVVKRNDDDNDDDKSAKSAASHGHSVKAEDDEVPVKSSNGGSVKLSHDSIKAAVGNKQSSKSAAAAASKVPSVQACEEESVMSAAGSVSNRTMKKSVRSVAFCHSVVVKADHDVDDEASVKLTAHI